MNTCVRLLLTTAAASLLCAADAIAADAYRCTAADGSVAFQDHACAPSEKERRLQLPQYAAPVPAPDDADSAPEAAPSSPPSVASATPVPSRTPPPDFFLCVRYDGSRYLSETGIGSSSAVPYGMLGDSGRGLAQAYGGRNGIGVSAPGLRTIPNVPASQAPIAGAYVWIDDQCHHAGPDEACAYLGKELDRVQDTLKRAFSDTEPQLKQQADTLRARMRGC